MFCKYCGQPIDEDSTFCKHCGRPLESSECNKNNYSSSGEPSIKIEMVKPNGKTEEEKKKVVLTILKELGILALMVGGAFLSKVIVYQIVNATPYPQISPSAQRAFNDELWERERNAGAAVLLGDIAWDYLKLGSFKWDDRITLPEQLEDINDARKHIIQIEADNASMISFWVMLFGLPILRYIILLVRWLNRKESDTTQLPEE